MVCALGEIRFNIPEDLHKALKMRALKEEKSLKALVIDLLEKEMKTDA